MQVGKLGEKGIPLQLEEIYSPQWMESVPIT